MNRVLAWAGVMVWMIGVGGAATVRFGEESYTVTEGEIITIPSLIELAGDEEDLFSYGVILRLDGGDADLIDYRDVTVPVALNFNGPSGSGAFKQVTGEFAGIKGTVDPSQDPLVGYAGPAFAAFEVSFSAPGIYTLRSDFFNTLGPTEAIFVTTTGAVLDPEVTFDTVQVTVLTEGGVIPELGMPTYLIFGGSVVLVSLLTRRRRC